MTNNDGRSFISRLWHVRQDVVDDALSRVDNLETTQQVMRRIRHLPQYSAVKDFEILVWKAAPVMAVVAVSCAMLAFQLQLSPLDDVYDQVVQQDLGLFTGDV